MFLGEFAHSIDDKGRVAIPARFREALTEGIMLTRGYERCIQVFPRSTWESLRQRVSALPVGNEDVRNLRRLLFSGAADVEIDRQGRVLLPPNLREYADLNDQVILVGNDSYFEMWSDERWRAVLETLTSSGSQLAQQLDSLML